MRSIKTSSRIKFCSNVVAQTEAEATVARADVPTAVIRSEISGVAIKKAKKA